jgi:hypothetical protein
MNSQTRLPEMMTASLSARRTHAPGWLALLVFLLLHGTGTVQASSLVSAKGTIAVDVYDTVAATADRSGMVRLFDLTNPGHPAMLSQFMVPRELTGVALAGKSLLVSGQGGVTILDISNPKSIEVRGVVELPAEAAVVRAAGDLAYTAYGSTVVLFRVATGQVLSERSYSSLEVNDLTLWADHLYVLSADAEGTDGIALAKVQVQGSLGQPLAAWTSSKSQQAGLGRLSLYAADNLIYVGSVISGGGAPGLETIQDMGSSFKTVGLPAQSNAGTMQTGTIRPSGEGLLAFTGTSSEGESANRIGVLDMTDPSRTDSLLQTMETSGPAYDIALHGEYAYVAAGTAGLQVIAYASPAGLKKLPALVLNSSVVAETPLTGSLMRMTADVAAADQVSKVDFYVNGALVATDGNYPFEYRFPEADLSSAGNLMAYACAEDIDGNRSCTTPKALNAASSGGLKVVSVTPALNAHAAHSTKLSIAAQFSQALDATTVAIQNVTVVKQASGKTPAATIALSGVTYQASSKSLVIQPKSPLATGSYQVTLAPSIRSSGGVTLASSYTWTFNVTPATDTWVNPENGDWSVGTNWSLGAAPATGDTAVIGVAGVTVTLGTSSGNVDLAGLTVGATNTLNVAGGSLSIEGGDNAAISGTLNFSGGTLGGPGTISVAKTMNWSNGSIQGILTIASGAVMNIVTPNNGCCNAAEFSLSGATVNNNGTVNHSLSGGGTGLYVYNGSVINNAGSWNVTNDVSVTMGDSSASVFNNEAAGKFNKTGGTNTTTWSLPFAGAGAINIQSGTLSLTGTYTKTITGAIAISTLAQLNYGQGGTLDGGKVTGTGTLNFNASATVAGAYSFAGITDITSGTVSFTGATTIATLNLINGTMVGTAPVTVTGTMNWTDGAIQGTLTIPAGAVLNIVTANNGCCNAGGFSLNEATLNNSGTVNLSSGGGGTGFYVYNGSVINNVGTWNVTSDVSVSLGDASASVFNNTSTGKFNKTGGTNTTTWSLPFSGAGPINILSGTLSLSGNYTKTITGTIAISSLAQLNYGQGGTLDGSKVTGTGTLNFNQSVTVAGGYTFAGITDISNGTVSFTGATTIATLNMINGTMVGTAPVTVTGTMNWTNGAIQGTLNIPAAAVLNIVAPNNGCCNAGAFSLNGAILNNSGTVNHSLSGGGTGLYVYNGSVINNVGTWNVTNDVSVTLGDASASVFNNTSTGKFNKTGGTNTTTWSLPFSGAGPINILSGTLSLSGNYTKTITGTIAISSLAQLNYGQGGTLDGGKVTGTGTLNFNASATVAGGYTFAGTTDITSGTVNFTGNTTIAALNLMNGTMVGTYPVTVTGTMNWTNGAIQGKLLIPSGAVLNIVTANNGCCNAGGFSMSEATLTNSGTVNLSSVGGGTGLYLYNGSVINNAATWNVTSDVSVSLGDSSASLFNNESTGKFNKVGGTNTTNWSLPFTGAGPINIQSGTLTMNGTYTDKITGTIAISTLAQLNYGQGGTLDGGKVTGTGTLNFDASTTLAGAYSFAGTTDITGGSVSFTGATTIATLNLIGGTMVGTAPVTVTGTMNWTNGVIEGTLVVPAGAVLNIVTPNNGCCNAGGFALSEATLTNSGTVNLSSVGGGTGLYLYNGSVINNVATWNVTSDVSVSLGDSSASLFNNASTGKFNKIGGTNTSNWSLPFTGAGPITIQSGTLSLNGTYTKTITGTIAIATQAQLNYGQGGTLDGGMVTGTGTMNFNASATVAGTYSFAGTTDITGGTINFTGTTSIATLNLIGGTMIGAAPVTVTGTMNWTNGTIQGTLDIPAAAVLNMVTPNNGCCNAAGFSLSKMTLNNSGTVNLSSAGGGTGLYLYSGSVINNAGTWNVIGNVSVTVGDTSASVINNVGTNAALNFNSGTNNLTVPLHNTATVNVNNGTLNVGGTFQASQFSGTVNIADSAILNYAQQGTLTAGTVNGAGMFNISAGNSTSVGGTYTINTPAQVLGGTLTVNVGGMLNAGTLTLSSATLNVGGSSSINTLNVTAASGAAGSNVNGGGTINVNDTLNWGSGNLNVTGSISTNNLTLAQNSALNVQLGSSALTVKAQLTLNGNLTVSFTSTNPAVGTVFKVLNFDNGFLGSLLSGLLAIPIPGTNDELTYALTKSGLTLTVAADPPPSGN